MSDRKIYAYVDKANMAFYVIGGSDDLIPGENSARIADAIRDDKLIFLELVSGGGIAIRGGEIKVIKEISADEWARIERQQELRHASEDAQADEIEKRLADGPGGKILKPKFTIPGKKP